jgi:hypothetical protein
VSETGWTVFGIIVSVASLIATLVAWVLQPPSLPLNVRNVMKVVSPVVLVLALAFLAVRIASDDDVGCQAKILSPPDDASVPRQTRFEGEAESFGPECKLWLIGTPPGSSDFYPQDGPIVVDSTNAWSVEVFVETDREHPEKDIGQTFIYRTVIVDPETSRKFERCDRIDECMLEIPPTADIGPPVTVVRQ